MESRELVEIGLTEGESKVYIALLRTGISTIGAIIKEAEVSNSKIYSILDRLNKKGLVGISINNGKKTFEAKDPSRINEFIELKEKNLAEEKKKVERIIPALQKIYNNPETSQETEILQGTKGIKTFTEIILTKLEKGDTFYILGAPKESTDLLGGYFKEWHERRIKKGVFCKILYNDDLREWAEMRKKTFLTEAKFLPKEIKTPALVDIGKDYVATILFTDKPICFVIRNKKVAESYISYFELLWKVAKN